MRGTVYICLERVCAVFVGEIRVLARECARVCEGDECTPLSPAQTPKHAHTLILSLQGNVCVFARERNIYILSHTRTTHTFPRKHAHTLISHANTHTRCFLSQIRTRALVSFYRALLQKRRVSIAKTHTLTSPASTHTRVFPSLTRTNFYFHRKYAHALLSLAHTLISPAQTQTHSLANMQTHTFSRLVGSLRL